jgi:hypothetical protein
MVLSCENMLTADRSWFTKTVLSLGVAAIVAFGATGCGAAIDGEHDTSINFLVEPQSDGSFWGWTDITVGADINSVGTANLWGVTLSVEKPATVTDLTFFSTLTGQAVTPAATTTVATLDTFPRDQTTVSMNVVYLGDLHPLFESSNEIRLVWTGTVNPAFTAWPTGGIWVQGDVRINVQ